MGTLSTTDPRWIDQRMFDGVELTSEEQETSSKQAEGLEKSFDILNQHVPAGDMKAARARVDALKQQFESLSPEMKEYMYASLQTKMGKKDLSGLFHYKLSSESRDKLLKILNPDHKIDHVQPRRPLNEEETNDIKASRTAENNMQAAVWQRELSDKLPR